MMWEGWIAANLDQQNDLVKLGVIIGRYDEDTYCFENCTMTDEVFMKLEPLWNMYMWGLEFSPKLTEDSKWHLYQ